MEDSDSSCAIKTVNSTFLKDDKENDACYKKISEVEKDAQISIDEDTIFEFSCTSSEEQNELCIELSEIGALCPYIYQRKLNLNDMINIHKVFKACDSIKEVETHINSLFKQGGKIYLSPNDPKKKDNDIIILHIKIAYFASEEEREIQLFKVMTSEKDKTLENLYKIQKNGDKVFKNIKKYMETNGLRDALKKLIDLEEEFKNNLN